MPSDCLLQNHKTGSDTVRGGPGGKIHRSIATYLATPAPLYGVMVGKYDERLKAHLFDRIG